MADDRRSSAIENLTLAFLHEDKHPDTTSAELRNLSLQMSHLVSALVANQEPLKNPRLYQSTDFVDNLLKELSSTRPIAGPSAARNTEQQLPGNNRTEDRPTANGVLQKQVDQTPQPAQVNYTFNSAVPLVAGAIVHRSQAGDPDYWLIERSGEQVIAKVIPLNITNLGVSVYRIDDNRNYILTMDGGWMGSN